MRPAHAFEGDGAAAIVIHNGAAAGLRGEFGQRRPLSSRLQARQMPRRLGRLRAFHPRPGGAAASPSRPSIQAGRNASSHAATRPSCWYQPPRWPAGPARPAASGARRRGSSTGTSCDRSLPGGTGGRPRLCRIDRPGWGNPCPGGEEFGAVGQVEPVGVPLVDAARKRLGAEPVGGGSRAKSGNSRSRCACPRR